MIEHPDKTLFQGDMIGTLMHAPTMLDDGAYYHFGGNAFRDGSDCSGWIVGQRRHRGWRQDDQTAHAMYLEWRDKDRPTVLTTGSHIFYLGSDGTMGHVTVGYDDKLAFGANNGTKSCKSRKTARSLCAGWQACRPDYRPIAAIYMPDYYPWIRVTTDNLNVRNMATLRGQVIQVLPQNSVVELVNEIVTEADGYKWMFVGNGYVASEFLKR